MNKIMTPRAYGFNVTVLSGKANTTGYAKDLSQNIFFIIIIIIMFRHYLSKNDISIKSV